MSGASKVRVGTAMWGLAAVLTLCSPPLLVAQDAYSPVPVIKGIEPLKIGDKAPLFTVKDLEGKTFSLAAELPKRAHLLVFWSIYCEPCREEMPLIEKARNQYKGGGIEILTVNMDGDPFLDAVKGFVKQGKYTFRTLMDELQNDSFTIADPYNVAGTPVIYIVDTKGTIAYHKIGRITEEELTREIERVLAAR